MKNIIKTIVLAAAVSLSLGAQAQGFFKKTPAQEPAAASTTAAPSPAPAQASQDVKVDTPAAPAAAVAKPAAMPKPSPAAKPVASAATAPKPTPKPAKPTKVAEKQPKPGTAMKAPAPEDEKITITHTRTFRERQLPHASQVSGEQKIFEAGEDPISACAADGMTGFLGKGCAGLRCIKDKYAGHSYCVKLAADAEARRASEQSHYR